MKIRFRLACLLTLFAFGTAQAADISWSPAFEIETDADIDLSGEIVRAVNVASPDVGEIEVTFPGDITVEFEPEHTFEFNEDLGGVGGGSVTGQGNFFTGQDFALTTENDELDLIMDSHGWTGGGPQSALAALELTDLTVGQTYQIQLIGAADDRGCCEFRQMQIVDEDYEPMADANGDELWFGRTNDFDEDDERGPGSTIGTFTADASEQLIFLTGNADLDDGAGNVGGAGNDPGLSAYVLSLSGGGGDLCDYNSDGNFDAADIDILAAALRAGDTDAKFDITGDGTVDAADHVAYVHDKAGTWVGDANLDGEFNSTDFVTLFTIGEYEDAVDGNSGWAEGDFNGDADFTSGDFVAAFSDGGYENGPRAATAAVPEPGSMLLSLIGLAGFAALRRK